MKKRITTADKNETKDAKFRRLASKRLQKAVKAVSMLQNLMGSNYASTLEQRDYVLNRLQMAMDAVKAKYNKEEQKEESIEIPI